MATTDKRIELDKTISSANLQYSLKNYDEAAEIYSKATEIQAELNGEMHPGNAELLYLYGRCLFKVAVSKSDVLGGQVAGEKKKTAAAAKAASKAEKKQTDEAVKALAPLKSEGSGENAAAKQPFFQITGDENWDTDSDEEDTAEGDADPAEEEDDDFATAYEILDVARVLYQKLLEKLGEDETSADGKGKGKATGELTPQARHVKERLADTHDLQAEISLENERFHDAIDDSRASLVLRQEIFPKESAMIAEAHYKLALALEFASVTAVRGAEEASAPVAAESDVDQKMRDEAAENMDAAIESCRARVASEEKKLGSLAGDEAREKKKEIVEVQEIIADMKQRAFELRAPPEVSLGEPGGPGADAMSSLLAQVLGQGKAEKKAVIEEATKNATDLSGLVRKKPKAEAKTEPSNGTTASNGKRKLGDDAEDSDSKKTRVDA